MKKGSAKQEPRTAGMKGKGMEGEPGFSYHYTLTKALRLLLNESLPEREPMAKQTLKSFRDSLTRARRDFHMATRSGDKPAANKAYEEANAALDKFLEAKKAYLERVGGTED